jgi:hypothetical protein
MSCHKPTKNHQFETQLIGKLVFLSALICLFNVIQFAVLLRGFNPKMLIIAKKTAVTDSDLKQLIISRAEFDLSKGQVDWTDRQGLGQGVSLC